MSFLYRLFCSLLACLFLCNIAYRSPVWLAYHLLLSLWTLWLYRYDKQTALTHADRRRIPENRLYLLNLLGGWPGALMARFLFRHKTRKIRFICCFWLTLLINILISAYFLYTIPY